MGGGGGDGGYGERQDKIDNDKAAARRQLNALFGVAPSGGSTVRQEDFWREVAVPGAVSSPDAESGGSSNTAGMQWQFDQAGYDAALAAEKALGEEAAKNKTGLEELFGTVRTNAFNAGKTRIDEQKGQAARDLKFELFARGLDSGSVDVDQNALLGRTYTQGITDLSGKADTAATQLRGDNEAARLQLLQSIDSGMDANSALSSAMGQMKVNSDRAAADAIGTSVGDLFTNAALIYNQNRVAQGKQNPTNFWGTTTSGARSGSSGARSGVVTSAG